VPLILVWEEYRRAGRGRSAGAGWRTAAAGDGGGRRLSPPTPADPAKSVRTRASRDREPSARHAVGMKQ